MKNRSLSSSYPLSRSSHHRRRMMIICNNQTVEQCDLSSKQPVNSAPISSTISPSFVENKKLVTPAISSANKQLETSGRKNKATPLSAFIGIRQLLQQSDSLCWVFAGGQTGGKTNVPRDNRPFSHLFAEFLHLGLHRMHDDVVNVELESTEQLLENIEEQVLRFLPDVVSIAPTWNDCIPGRSQRAAYRKRLRNIIEVIRQSNAIPLLQMPYRVDPILQSQLTRLPAYVKMMREVACEKNVPCIDHWEHWKPLCDHPQKLARLLSEDGLYLNDKGNIAAARLMIKRLRIECHLPDWCDYFSLSSQNNPSTQNNPLSQTMAAFSVK